MNLHLSHYCILVVCFTSAFSLFASQHPKSQAAELFVADRASDRVLSFDESTGEFLRVVTDTGLDGPAALTMGPGGFLYVANVQGGPIEGFAASVVKVDPVTGTTTPFIRDVLGPGGIGYHEASDTLFVSEFGNFDGDEVFRYDATGNLIQTLGTGSAATGRAGIAFDDSGNIYVSESNFSGVGSVLKYDAPISNPADDYASTATTFASGADVTLLIPAPAGGFNGLAFDAAGDLFVVSLIGQSVVKYTVESSAVVDGAPFGVPLPYPSDVSIAADGNLLVTGLGNNNPGDPFYGSALFPGSINVFNSTFTGSFSLLHGDLNSDASVDGGDLAVWANAFGSAASGDLNGDFDTDGDDFLGWQRSLGGQGAAGDFQPTGIVRYGAPAILASVPEPSTLLLMLMFLCVHPRWRK